MKEILEQGRNKIALFAELYNTYIDKEPIYKDFNIWLKEKLTAFEKQTKEEFLKRILPEEMSTKTINHVTWNDNFVKGFNCCIKEITNNYNKNI